MAFFTLSLHGVGDAHRATYLEGITHRFPALLVLRCSLRKPEPSGYVHDPERTLFFLSKSSHFSGQAC